MSTPATRAHMLHLQQEHNTIQLCIHPVATIPQLLPTLPSNSHRGRACHLPSTGSHGPPAAADVQLRLCGVPSSPACQASSTCTTAPGGTSEPPEQPQHPRNASQAMWPQLAGESHLPRYSMNPPSCLLLAQ